MGNVDIMRSGSVEGVTAPHTQSPAATGGTLCRDGHPLVVVCGADDRFAMPLAVTLYSALANYRSSLPVKVFIIDGGIRAPNRLRVDRILEGFGAVAEWLEPDWRPLKRLAVSERYPPSTYLRLLIPTFLPKSLEKAIYLDSDVVVHGNIADLWNVELAGKVLLAVQDRGVPTVGSRWGLPNYRELGLDASSTYFNSGVLVLDLRAWRELDLADRVIEYLVAQPHQMRFGEQHAVNAMLARSWGALETRWNQQVWAWEEHDDRAYQSGILHFVSSSKPWNPSGAHWTNFIFDRYLKRSRWHTMLEWWRYHVPLLVLRRWVMYVRARRAGRSPRPQGRALG